jgi:hypothetical protein
MSTTIQTISSTQDSNSLFHWFKLAFQLFRKAPFTMIGLSLAIMIIAGVFQVFPAPYGVVMSKIVGAMLIPLLWIVMDQVSEHGRFKFASLTQYTGYVKLPLLAVVMLLPTIAQVITAAIMLGEQGVDLMLFGIIATTTALQIAIIFASAAPIMLIFMFAPAFVLLKQQSVIAAIKNSMKMVLKTFSLMLPILLLNAFVLFLAPFTLTLSAVILGPWLGCLTYVAYKELCR